MQFTREKNNRLAVAEFSEGGAEYLELCTDPHLMSLCVPLTGNCYFFNRLNVPKEMRGQGVATELMAEVTAWAQDCGALIINTVNAYGDMSHKDLVAFYAKHNFKVLDEGLMVYHRDLVGYEKKPASRKKL